MSNSICLILPFDIKQYLPHLASFDVKQYLPHWASFDIKQYWPHLTSNGIYLIWPQTVSASFDIKQYLPHLSSFDVKQYLPLVPSPAPRPLCPSASHTLSHLSASLAPWSLLMSNSMGLIWIKQYRPHLTSISICLIWPQTVSASFGLIWCQVVFASFVLIWHQTSKEAKGLKRQRG